MKRTQGPAAHAPVEVPFEEASGREAISRRVVGETGILVIAVSMNSSESPSRQRIWFS